MRRLPLVAALLGAGISLTACSPSVTGSLGLAVDPAGRLVAIVAVCDGKAVGPLTLTDQTTGTRTTGSPKTAPEFGGTVLLTAPVSGTPEGVLDLLDPGHDYRLDGVSVDSEGKENGHLEGVRFTLNLALTEKALREGSVLAKGKNETATVMTRDAFLKAARDRC